MKGVYMFLMFFFANQLSAFWLAPDIFFTSLKDRSKKCQMIHQICAKNDLGERPCLNVCDFLPANFYKDGEDEPYHCCMDFCRCECRFESSKGKGVYKEASIQDLRPET